MRTQDLQDDFMLQQGIIHLPRDIFSPCAEILFTSICYFRSKEPFKPIKLFCYSSGGDAVETFAIANLIRLDGNIEGHLVGESTSGGSVIWAACSKRYIYPNSRIGIHPCSFHGTDIELTAAVMYSMFRKYRAIDRTMCHIYAEASNKPFSWWWHILNRQGDIKWFTTKQLVELGMGQMINTEPNL